MGKKNEHTHTPGPWRVENSLIVAEPKGFRPTSDHPRFVIAQTRTFCSARGEEAEGNAKLMASSLNMWEAITYLNAQLPEKITGEICVTMGMLKAIGGIRSVIADVRGAQ